MSACVPSHHARLQEVSEDDKGYNITAEVPGFAKKDIKVTLTEDGMLQVEGEVRQEEDEPSAAATPGAEAGKDVAKQQAPARRSRRYMSFRRTLQLPPDAEAEGIKASTEHGVLTLHIPKAPRPQPKTKQIPVA